MGAPPKTMIEMQLGHSKGSMEMYLWLAYEFGKKWNCVVDDVNAVTVNYSEVCDRYTRSSIKQVILNKSVPFNRSQSPRRYR